MSKSKRRRKKLKRAWFGAEIRLENPVTKHFEAFIFGNATKCDHVVEIDSAKGQHLILCGAGPSLRDEADEWCPQGDQIWGCNSALTWLVDNGHNPTQGFCVDQTPAMVNEWASAPDVEYIIASTAHPHLVEHLEKHERRITFFHNYVGIDKRPVEYEGMTLPFEDWMYAALYPATIKAGSGLNAVTRAIDVASFMGFTQITVLGADCALRVDYPFEGVHGSPDHLKWLKEHTEMHADGGNALASNATPVTLGGEIDGRWWESKPDMIVSAVWLVRMGRALGDGFQLIGDTLPNALKDKSDKFLDRLPALVGHDGKPIHFPMPDADKWRSSPKTDELATR